MPLRARATEVLNKSNLFFLVAFRSGTTRGAFSFELDGRRIDF